MGIREEIISVIKTSRPDVVDIIESAGPEGVEFLRYNSDKDALVGDLYACLRASVTIVMDIEPKTDAQYEALQFAHSALDQDLLLPCPYTVCLFTGKLVGIEEGGLLVVREDKSRMWCLDLGITRTTESRRVGLSVGRKYAITAADGGVRYSMHVMRNDLFEQVPHDPDRDLYVNELMSYLGLLAMRVVNKSEAAPSDKLNKAREAKGKPKLGTVVTVRLDPSAVSAPGTGTHASPRAHWRRGHVRRLASGKIAMVTPHPVMGDAPIPSTLLVKK